MTGMVGGLALAYAGISLGIALVFFSLAVIAAVFVANRFAARLARIPRRTIP